MPQRHAAFDGRGALVCRRSLAGVVAEVMSPRAFGTDSTVERNRQRITPHLAQENPNSPSLSGNRSPVPYVEVQDVTKAAVWVAGPKARYVTGTTMPVDAGHAVM